MGERKVVNRAKLTANGREDKIGIRRA